MKLEVKYLGKPVGRLNDDTGSMLFQYDNALIAQAIELSPLYLPLQTGVLQTNSPFEGNLPGLFADSLPDYWGRTIMDRRLREMGIAPESASILKRLALVGTEGMGALTYHPAETSALQEIVELQEAIHFARAVIEESAEALPSSKALQEAGSNPGGRYPKLLVSYHPKKNKLAVGNQPAGFIPCLMKLDLGKSVPQAQRKLCTQEYHLLQLAQKLGLKVPKHWLLEGTDETGYQYSHLIVERFDRKAGQPIHMHTFGGITHQLSIRYGSSYEDLLRVVLAMTKDQREVDEQFARIVFNVLCQNRDDHVRNHSLLMNEKGEWSLSPVYDLTPTPEKEEHTLSIQGKWKNIDRSDLLEIGKKFSISNANEIIERHCELFKQSL